MPKFNTKKVVGYWIKNAELKWETAKSLKRSKKYSDCLFFCHLVLECLLKALVVERTGKEAPFIHNLVRLAELAELNLTADQKELLRVATPFNIRARYEDYKMAFYKKANKTYTDKYFEKSNEMRLWLLKRLPKKQR